MKKTARTTSNSLNFESVYTFDGKVFVKVDDRSCISIHLKTISPYKIFLQSVYHNTNSSNLLTKKRMLQIKLLLQLIISMTFVEIFNYECTSVSWNRYSKHLQVNQLPILCVNARSIVYKFPEFLLYLSIVKSKFTFILITETWLKSFSDW